MATPRKHWFRVADSVVHEPWSNDVAATFLRLLGHLNTRWAREGRTPTEACEVVLSRGTAMVLTGSGSLARARSILNELATHVSLVIDEQGANTLCRWPKYAEFQRLASESGVRPESVTPPAVPPPQDAPARRKTPPQEEKNTRAPRSPRVLPDEAVERVRNLVSQVLEAVPHQSVPQEASARWERWVLELDRLHRIGAPSSDGKGFTWETIDRVMGWLRSGSGERPAFWRMVCLSAKKFRVHFPRLQAEMEAKPAPSRNLANLTYRETADTSAPISAEERQGRAALARLRLRDGDPARSYPRDEIDRAINADGGRGDG